MTDSEKHSSLLQNAINYGFKKFYCTVPRLEREIVNEMTSNFLSINHSKTSKGGSDFYRENTIKSDTSIYIYICVCVCVCVHIYTRYLSVICRISCKNVYEIIYMRY